MLFNSIEYLFIFLPIVFIGYFILNKFKFFNAAKIFILLASLFFYGMYKWDYVYIIVASIIINYFLVFAMKKNTNNKVKKILLVLGILANILILIYFKYFNSVIEAINDLIGGNYNIIKIVMPIGINFFTLQQISYIVDAYQNKFKEYKFIDYALFVCFFPQLLAGPIVRHQEMIPQFNNINNRKINQYNIFIAIFLITLGLFKKAVLADGYLTFTHYFSDTADVNNFYIAWLLGISKLFRFYFDFSGYCDVALGSAFLFNIKLPRNFNSPFQTDCMIDYWNRTNMTMIRFLKDYIFKPLGGNKVGLLKSNFNYIFTFFIMGIWMGVNSVFIIFGLFNGIIVCCNYMWKKLNINMNKYIARIITFIFLVISGQFMFTNNINDVISSIKTMFGINAKYSALQIQNFNFVFYSHSAVIVELNILILLCSFLLLYIFKDSIELARAYAKANNSFYTVIISIVFIISVIFLTRTSEFIYFIF